MARRWVFSLTTAIIVAALLGVTSQSLADSPDETGELHFSILHTNDLHSALIPHSPAVDYHPQRENPAIGGFARLATAVREVREDKMERGEPVILLDAGDFLGGSAFGWLTLRGHAAELTVMQRIGYDAVVIGNHEYDFGPDVLGEYLMTAGYPDAHRKTLVLASNTRAPDDHPLAARNLYLNTGVLQLENGLTVGVFGLIGEGAVMVIGEPGDVEFPDQHDASRQAVDELKQGGADVIVAISHSGVDEDRELAREVQGIDVIVGGHCHTALYKPVFEGSTVIVQAGHLGNYLGQLELAYDPLAGRIRVRNEENDRPFLIPIDDSFAPDPEIDSMVSEYLHILNEQVGDMTEGRWDDVMVTIATSDFVFSKRPPLAETPVGNFVTDAMRLIAQNLTGKRVDIAVQANGAIRKSIYPGTMDHSKGHISFYELVEAIGMGSGPDGFPGCPLVSVYITGEEVRRLLEITILLQELAGDAFFLQVSGLRYSYNRANAVLLTVPFLDIPVPTTRAVTRAEIYTGEGIQPVDGEGYISLSRGDEDMYHLVTDAYILRFLPMVTALLPQLEIVAKNAAGEPVLLDRIDELMIRHADGREVKVWEAVVGYAAAQPMGTDGIPRVPDYYERVAGRINETWAFPFAGWIIMILIFMTAGILFAFRRMRRKRL